ncbi:MAG: hypothetical protein KGR26_09560, partial [Cyanobacteria bacterium REEB65]|nr:hypothetical protein [Cyanobacteria bacterium REEB65]
MQSKRSAVLALGLVLGAAALPLWISGCGSYDTTRSIGQYATGGTSGSDTGSTPGNQPQVEPQPTAPNGDPADVPGNMPIPIPSPSPAITPGSLTVQSIAYSESSYPLNPFGNFTRLVDIHIDLKWQLYPGATSYRISRNDSTMPQGQYALKTTVSATSLNQAFPFFWREYSIPAVSPLIPGNDYKYLVEALNLSNQVVAKGTDDTKPLYPLDVPKLTGPANNAAGAGIQPTFNWDTSTDGNADGYFVEVFSGAYFVPMWRGYAKGAQNGELHYGDFGDGYPGTLPSIWTS